MSNSIWSVTGGGVTAPSDVWGIEGMVHKIESAKVGTVTFKIPGLMDVSPPVFPVFSPFASLNWVPSAVTITRNGVTWFQGICTEVPRQGSPRGEEMQYVISDPWWFLENISFQQMWAAITGNVGGGLATSTISTTVSRILACQSLNGTKINLGQLIQEVLIYALYAAQGVPFPSIVAANNLPPYPVPNPVYPAPFQIGAVTPSLVIPYFEVRDLTCAEIIKKALAYLPDTVAWFDHTTSPPTLHFDTRANLGARTIKVVTSHLPTDGYFTSGFNPTAQTKLQVPAVIAKYEASESIDGAQIYVVWVDKYPTSAPDNCVGALVQTMDLIGSSISLAKQTVSVVSRPTTSAFADQVINWLLRDQAQLSQYDISQTAVDGGRLQVNVAGITCAVDPASPILKVPINWPADGSGLTHELVDGAVTPWMYDDAGLVAADATITVPLTYTGTDGPTTAYFETQPTPGTLIVAVKCKITNAGGVSGWTSTPVTAQYSTVASFTEGEAPPTGYAQYLYNILSELHQKGTLEITEQECSGMLPMGCIFNALDGLAEWQSMNALVISVTEDIDHGKTTVEFGPTLYLGLAQMLELRRANTGRLLSYAMNQRTTGQTAGAAQIQGHNQSAARSTQLPPGGGGYDTNPYYPTDASAGATPKVAISAGTTGLTGATTTTGSPVTVPQGNGIIYIKTDFTYDAYNTVTVIDSSFVATSATNPPASTCTPSSGGSGGSGTLYQKCASFNTTVNNGKASTSPKRLIGGAQNFGVCNGAITGPWGV